MAHEELAWLFHEPHKGLDDCLIVLQSSFRKRRSGLQLLEGPLVGCERVAHGLAEVGKAPCRDLGVNSIGIKRARKRPLMDFLKGYIYRT